MMNNNESYLCVDTGQGFDESLPDLRPIPDESGKIQFELDEFGSINRLRFYPVKDFVVLKVHEIFVYRNDESFYRLDYFKTNAVNNHHSTLSFSNKEPFIELCLFSQKIKCIAFNIEYFLTGAAALDHVYKSIKKDFDDTLYREQLKREESAEQVSQLIDFQQMQLAQLEKKINTREITGQCIGPFNKEKFKKHFEWLRPVYDELYPIKHRKKQQWFRLSSTLTSALRALFKKHFNLVKNSGLFDTAYYIAQYPNSNDGHIHPILHYLKYGNQTKKNPHPLFWTEYYLAQNPELKVTETNALVHYIQTGAKMGKNPCPLFDTHYYLDKNPDARESGVNPLYHYLSQESQKGRDPHPLFETAYYLRNNPDVAISDLDPLSHYVRSGYMEKRDPGPFFDTSHYSHQNRIDLGAGINPLAHYIETPYHKRVFPNRAYSQLDITPKISVIVPVFNVDQCYLNKCIRSVLNQWYINWELCIVDDGSDDKNIASVLKSYEGIDDRIKISILPENTGLSEASNHGVQLATGDFIGFLDHDDELSKECLFEIVKSINRNNPDIIYTDEAIVNEQGLPVSAVYKPDFSPDLLLSHNYITHFCVIRRALFHSVGGFSKIFDGAQDYDLILKASEKTDKIAHIPKVLYYWRQSKNSTSANPMAKEYAHNAGKTALKTTLKRRNIEADVLNNNRLFHYRIKWKIAEHPLISIIIPFKDKSDYLQKCIDAIMEKTVYRYFEIIGIDNGSEKEETALLTERLSKKHDQVQFYRRTIPFNYSKLNNIGVSLAKGSHIVLMNNDIEIENPDWIEALLEHSQRKEVGAVGAKLSYPDGTIQHGGIILGIGGFAGHSHRHHRSDDAGYYHRLKSVQNVSAVTGALMMVKTSLYQEMGGLDEMNFSVALNDVDFCLKLRKSGFLNIFTPFCRAIHHESISRGYEETPEKKRRFFLEVKNFKQIWKTELEKGDPYYNPNLTLTREDFSTDKTKLTAFA